MRNKTQAYGKNIVLLVYPLINWCSLLLQWCPRDSHCTVVTVQLSSAVTFMSTVLYTVLFTLTVQRSEYEAIVTQYLQRSRRIYTKCQMPFPNLLLYGLILPTLYWIFFWKYAGVLISRRWQLITCRATPTGFHFTVRWHGVISRVADTGANQQRATIMIDGVNRTLHSMLSNRLEWR